MSCLLLVVDRGETLLLAAHFGEVLDGRLQYGQLGGLLLVAQHGYVDAQCLEQLLEVVAALAFAEYVKGALLGRIVARVAHGAHATARTLRRRRRRRHTTAIGVGHRLLLLLLLLLSSELLLELFAHLFALLELLRLTVRGEEETIGGGGRRAVGQRGGRGGHVLFHVVLVQLVVVVIVVVIVIIVVLVIVVVLVQLVVEVVLVVVIIVAVVVVVVTRSRSL